MPALIGATHVRIASDVDLYGFETINIGDRMEMIPVMGREWIEARRGFSCFELDL